MAEERSLRDQTRAKRAAAGVGPASGLARSLIVIGLVGLVAAGCGGPQAHKLLSERSGPGRASRSHGADEPGDDRGTEALAPPFDRRAAPLHDRLGRTDVVRRRACGNHSQPCARAEHARFRARRRHPRPARRERATDRGRGGRGRTGQQCRPDLVSRPAVGDSERHRRVRARPSLRLYRVTSRVVIDLSKRTCGSTGRASSCFTPQWGSGPPTRRLRSAVLRG